MTLATQLSSQAALLRTRRDALRRDSVIIGTVFLISLTATFALGMIFGLDGRSIYLIAAANIAFAIGYIQTWVRLEITKESLSLLETLQRGER